MVHLIHPGHSFSVKIQFISPSSLFHSQSLLLSPLYRKPLFHLSPPRSQYSTFFISISLNILLFLFSSSFHHGSNYDLPWTIIPHKLKIRNTINIPAASLHERFIFVFNNPASHSSLACPQLMLDALFFHLFLSRDALLD